MLLDRRSAPISRACVQSKPVTREPDPVVPTVGVAIDCVSAAGSIAGRGADVIVDSVRAGQWPRRGVLASAWANVR